MSARRDRPFRQRLTRLIRPAWLGTLRGSRPFSRNFGYDRGTPIDRYYIERFIAQHRADVVGAVLEVKEAMYTARYGSGIERSEVLDVYGANPRATLVADLAGHEALPDAEFDCFILTQTLHLIYDVRAAVLRAHGLLRPGGVLLATVPAVIRLADPPEPDYWRFTAASCSRLFGDVFGSEHVTVRSHGNVLTCAAFLAGMSKEELGSRVLEQEDPLFPLTVTIRAVRATSARTTAPPDGSRGRDSEPPVTTRGAVR